MLHYKTKCTYGLSENQHVGFEHFLKAKKNK